MWEYVIIAVFTLLLIWVVKFVNWVWIEPKKMEKFFRKQGLKGNSYKLLFGDADEISDMYKEAYSKTLGLYDDILPRVMPFINKTVEKYGKNSFTWVGPKPQLIISEAELVKIVLNKHRIYQKSFNFKNKIARLVVGGIVYYEGDEWSKSRMKLNPAFHVNELKQKVPEIEACCEDILNQLKNKILKDGSNIVDVLDSLEDYSGSVVTRALFSTPFTPEMRRTFHYLRDLSIMTNTASQPFNIPGFWYFPTERKRKALAMEKEIRNSLTSMINERLNVRNAAGGPDGQDLLDLFLDELYDGTIKSNRVKARIIEDAVAQCKVFYFGGYDTTSNLLLWTLITLASHQNWQTRAREEVFQVLGNSNELTHDSLNQLKIVSMIIYEVLRLYPPVMELSRIVEEETELGGYRIPKGILVQVPIAILQRSTEIWGEDALEFKPDRFAEGVLKASKGHAAFMPFSWGPRICIGQNFALMEGKAFLALFLRTFSFELSPTYKHAPYAAFTVQAQYGAPLVLNKL
ncbi:hypothetical protein ACJIZ3_017542 [Penstemon smallii]|uniref:Cytochrome P450 n=1 Tax=Penstemon smallii TaxID=265156 RepID=A0ABD3SVU5_9LAMI